GKTGVLVEPSRPDLLAEGILRLLRDPVAAQQYGMAGRKLMLGHFTLRHTVDHLAELYRRKFDAHPMGYRSYVIAARLAIGSLLCLLIVGRYCILDAWILRHWDQGWRPWRTNAFSLIPVRMWLYRFYALLGRHSMNFGIRRRIYAFSLRHT